MRASIFGLLANVDGTEGLRQVSLSRGHIFMGKIRGTLDLRCVACIQAIHHGLSIVEAELQQAKGCQHTCQWNAVPSC